MNTSGNATVGGTLTAGASSLTSVTTSGNVVAGGSLGVTGASNLTGTVTASNNLIVNGNVGVGITPTSKLHVSGNGNITGNTIIGGSLNVGANSAITSQGTYLQWNRVIGEGETWLINQKGTGNSNASIRFGASNLANVVTEHMRIMDSNGFVGIGVTSPTSRLHVDGDVQATTVTAGVAVSTLAVITDTLDVTTQANVTAVIVGGDGGVLTTVPGIKMKSVSGRDKHLIIGQSDTNNAFMAWRYNATVANAFLTLSTYNGSNSICLQADGGRVAIGVPNATTYGRLHLATASAPTVNPIIFEAGSFHDGSAAGVSAINFNGYTTSANQRVNTGKNRWRFVCPQNSTNDYLSIDTFNGTTNTELMRFNTNGVVQCPTNLAINTSTGPYGKLHLASGTTNCNIVIEAGATADGTVTGLSAINFNGCYSGGELRINTSKNRWRMLCDQRSTTDKITFEKFDGTTGTPVLSLENSNNIRVSRQPIIQRPLTSKGGVGSAHTYTVDDVVASGIVHQSGGSAAMPSYSDFTNVGYTTHDTFRLVIANINPTLVLTMSTGGTFYGSASVGANGIGNLLLRLNGSAIDVYRMNN